MSEKSVAVRKHWMPWHALTVPLTNEVWLKPLTKKVVAERAKHMQALTGACGIMALSFWLHTTYYALVPGLICSWYLYRMLGDGLGSSNSPHYRARHCIANQRIPKVAYFSYLKPHELEWLEHNESHGVLDILKPLSIEQGFLLRGQVLAARCQSEKNRTAQLKSQWGQSE